MDKPNRLLRQLESRRLWAPFQKDWLIEDDVRVEVSLASALGRSAAFNPWERILGEGPGATGA